MGRVILKVIMIIMPVLLFYGLMRMALHPDGNVTFLPTWNEILGMFSTVPDIREMTSEALSSFMESYNAMTTAFGYVNDLVSFFTAIGSFFVMVGAFFVFIGKVLFIPFRYIWWFVYTFFSIDSAVVA